MPDAEHVLRVDRRVVAGAACRDDDVIDLVRADRCHERPDDIGRPGEEPPRDLGLFEDLGRAASCRGPATGSRPVALRLAVEHGGERIQRPRQDRVRGKGRDASRVGRHVPGTAHGHAMVGVPGNHGIDQVELRPQPVGVDRFR